jgi:hypothetical protein
MVACVFGNETHTALVRFHPNNRYSLTEELHPLCADTVEKVENRKTPKISQMLIFGQVRRWDAA